MAKLRRLFGIGLTSKPWRAHSDDFEFKEDTYKNIMKSTEEMEPLNHLSEKKLNILVIGPKAHGKSSLINSISSISQGKQVSTCNVGGRGGDGDNVTLTYRHYDLPGRFQNFRLCDVRGLIKERDASRCYVQDLVSAIEGKIKTGYEFDVQNKITEESPFYNSKPTLQDRIHCAIIVFDINETYEIHERYTEDIKFLSELFNRHNIPVFLFLTKVDTYCKHVRADITTIYRSKKVRDAVHDTEKSLGIRRKNVFPVVNFEADNVNFGPMKALPLLVALNDCIDATRHHLFNTERDSRICKI